MPGGIVSIICLMCSTYIITKGYQRWFAIIGTLAIALLGACLMSFSPKHNHAALLAGIYLINAVRLLHTSCYYAKSFSLSPRMR
jgi:hypothetical protein